ncbi:MAG: LysR family transcriptional regulator [Planctomycetia bacterium]
MASERPARSGSRSPPARLRDIRRFKQLRFRQLRAFVALSAEGSFAAVAQKLELSVPSVWQQLRALENEFVCDLVHTEGRRLVFTDRGRLLLSMAAPLVKGFDELVETFSLSPDAAHRVLSIAAPGEILSYDLPGVLERFRRLHPDIEVCLYDRSSKEAIGLVEKGEVDVAVAGQLEEPPPPALRCERVAEYPFMLIAREDHPLATAKRLSPRQIGRHPLVVFAPGTNNRQRLDAVFSEAGVGDGLTITMEANSKALLLNYVQMGFGASVASMGRLMTEPPPRGHAAEGVVYRDVSRTFGHEHINLFVRRARYQPAHEKTFCDMLLEACGGK